MESEKPIIRWFPLSSLIYFLKGDLFVKKALKRLAAGIVIPSLLVLGACGSGSNDGGTTGGAPAEGIQERTINAGIGLSETNPQGQGLVKFKELVEEKSEGKIKVNVFFDAALGDDIKMTEALQAGTQEITIPSTSPLVGMLNDFAVFDLPFIFNSNEEADAILDGEVGQKVMDKLPELGLVGLGYWENGFRQITNSKRPIEKAEDLQGLKLRTMQNEVHLEAFEVFGANPTPMAFSEVFTALENNTIDGQENPIPTIYSQRFHEVQDYMTISNHVYTPYIVLVSKKFWDGLSEEEQQILQEAATEARDYQRQLNRDENERMLNILQEEGLQVNELPDSERERLQEMLQPTLDKYAEEIGPIAQELFDAIDELRSNENNE